MSFPRTRSPEGKRESRYFEQYWTPAFAGVTLMEIMELFFNRSVQNHHLAAFRSVRISIEPMLQDGGFERIRFLPPRKSTLCA